MNMNLLYNLRLPSCPLLELPALRWLVWSGKQLLFPKKSACPSYLKVKLSRLAIGKVLPELETQAATPSETGNPQGRIGHRIRT